MARILGIDPGLNVTGYAVVEGDARPAVCEAGILKGEGDNLPDRLLTLHTSLLEVIDQYRPEVMVVEQLFAHYAHPRTAIIMGHARGVLILAAAARGLATVGYAATRIKKAITGSGRATKDQMQRTIQRELGLARLPEPADVADALAGALCHFYLSRARPSGLTA